MRISAYLGILGLDANFDCKFKEFNGPGLLTNHSGYFTFQDVVVLLVARRMNTRQ